MWAVRAEKPMYTEPPVAPHHALGERAGTRAMEQRLKAQPELYSRRNALAEHPFGSMKRWMDQGYSLMKGLEKAGAVFSLTVLAYNLRRVITLLGVPRMMAALP